MNLCQFVNLLISEYFLKSGNPIKTGSWCVFIAKRRACLSILSAWCLTSQIHLETGHSKQQQGGRQHWCTGYSSFSLSFKSTADRSSSAWTKTGYYLQKNMHKGSCPPCCRDHQLASDKHWDWHVQIIVQLSFKLCFCQDGKLLFLLCQSSPKVCSAALKT